MAGAAASAYMIYVLFLDYAGLGKRKREKTKLGMDKQV